jgi:hypothetical protein
MCELFLCMRGVADFEILETREEPNEVQDLPAGTSRTLESKESKSWCEVSEALMDVWHEVEDLEIIYPKLLEVREYKNNAACVCQAIQEWTQQADMESLDEWKQTKLLGFLE